MISLLQTSLFKDGKPKMQLKFKHFKGICQLIENALNIFMNCVNKTQWEYKIGVSHIFDEQII